MPPVKERKVHMAASTESGERKTMCGIEVSPKRPTTLEMREVECAGCRNAYRELIVDSALEYLEKFSRGDKLTDIQQKELSDLVKEMRKL